MLTGRIPSAHGINGSTVGRSNAIGHNTLPTVCGPRSLGTLRRTLELGRGRPNSAIRMLAVKPSHTTRIVHRDVFHNTSNNCLLDKHRFTNSSALTASCTLSYTLHGLKGVSIVVYNHRTVSNSATRINPRITRGLNLPRVACTRRVLAISGGRVAIGHHLRHNFRIIGKGLPLLIAIGKSTTPYHPRRTGLALGCGYTRAIARTGRYNESYNTIFTRHPCLGVRR